MELKDLDWDQKNTFLSLVHKVAIVDGKVVPGEVEMINALTKELGPEARVVAEEVYGTPRTVLFPDRDSQHLILTWLYRVAYSDVHFHVDEISVIDALTDALGTSATEVDEIRENVCQLSPDR